MIKRVPQEIADFFQCYVAQDEDGDWYMYKDKPMRNEDRGIWVGSIDDPLRIPYMTVEIPDNHFWTMLYEPRSCSEKIRNSINKEASYSEKAPVSENKPDHLGEVYTHKEYRIVTAHKEIDSESFAKGVMAWVERGWIPTGGISFDKQGCPYQAMVRGI